ncbi:MAG: DinB family protein [Planctomycetota bacterium]
MKQQVANHYRYTLDQALRLTRDVECADCAKLPHEAAKHPGWVLSHLAAGSSFAAQLLGVDSGVPEDWMKLYGPGSEPGADRGAYPKKDELVSVFKNVHEAVTPAFERAADDLLAAPLPMEEYREFWPTVGDGLFYLLATHEPYHLGQLAVWRRAAGMGTAEGSF